MVPKNVFLFLQVLYQVFALHVHSANIYAHVDRVKSEQVTDAQTQGVRTPIGLRRNLYDGTDFNADMRSVR